MGAPDHRAAAREVKSVSYAVLTVSDSRTEATDDSGRLVRALFDGAGHTLGDYELVRNFPQAIQAAVRRFLQGPAACLVTTGGTGLARRDVLPIIFLNLRNALLLGLFILLLFYPCLAVQGERSREIAGGRQEGTREGQGAGPGCRREDPAASRGGPAAASPGGHE